MTDRFVDSAGSNTAPYDTWAKAATKLSTVLTSGAGSGVAQAGDTVYVASTHSESTAAGVTLFSNGTAASPIKVLAVVKNGASGNSGLSSARAASVAVTGAGNPLLFDGGHAYFWGIDFKAANDGASTIGGIISFSTDNAFNYVFDGCNLKQGTTDGSSGAQFGNATGAAGPQAIELINTKLEFASTAFFWIVPCQVTWRDTATAIVGATLPTSLFATSATLSKSARLVVSGVDLSALGSGKNLVDVSANGFIDALFRDCKLGSSVSLKTGSFNGPQQGRVRLHNCDSADTNYRMQEESYPGSVVQETTVVKSSGASDGTTSLSWKMVSGANAKFHAPLVTPDILFWNDNSGSSKTVTVEVVSDNVTFTDAELWLEVEYDSDGSFPLNSRASDRAADILATPANQTSSSVTWTTTGLATPVKQALAVTFTPGDKGLFRARVCLAKASSTVYVDPLLTVS